MPVADILSFDEKMVLNFINNKNHCAGNYQTYNYYVSENERKLYEDKITLSEEKNRLLEELNNNLKTEIERLKAENEKLKSGK